MTFLRHKIKLFLHFSAAKTLHAVSVPQNKFFLHFGAAKTFHDISAP